MNQPWKDEKEGNWYRVGVVHNEELGLYACCETGAEGSQVGKDGGGLGSRLVDILLRRIASLEERIDKASTLFDLLFSFKLEKYGAKELICADPVDETDGGGPGHHIPGVLG